MAQRPSKNGRYLSASIKRRRSLGSYMVYKSAICLWIFSFHERDRIFRMIKYLVLQTHCNLNWPQHNECSIPKLSCAFSAIWTVMSFMKIENLKLVCIACFHFITSHGIIFWGNLTDTKKVFWIHKKIIGIMASTKMQVSCRELLRKFNILLLSSQFILSVL
jgi:hypothetical protein